MKVFKQRNDACCEDDELIPGITFAKRPNDAFSEPPLLKTFKVLHEGKALHC